MKRTGMGMGMTMVALLCAQCGGPVDPGPEVPGEVLRVELVASGTSARLNAISGTGGADLWAVGEAGTILHHDGGGFRAVASGTAAELRAVAARDPKDAWAVGDGVMLHYDENGWRPAGHRGQAGGADGAYGAVLALAAEDVWVGGKGVAGRRGGTGWSLAYQSRWAHELRALHALPGHLWIAGDRGVLLHAPSSAGEVGPWELVALPTSAALRGIAGGAADEIWVVGDGGEVLRVDGRGGRGGDGGQQERVGAAGALHAVATAGEEVWAVGEQGVVLRRRQGTWGVVQAPTTATLRGVWADGARIWAVGDAGTVIRVLRVR